MADISALGQLNSSEPLDLDQYADAKESTFQLPKKGRYTVRAPETFSFGKTKNGDLSAQVDPTIVSGPHENFTIRFVKASAKPFVRSGQKVSQVGDYLRACGVRGEIPASPQAIADAVEQTANTVYEIDLDWRAYNTTTGFSLEGMEKFPSDGNGGHQSWVVDPNDTDESGNPKRVRANLNVVRFVAAR